MEITQIVDEEERIAALEKRVRNMDALVRGLVAEMLDLKTVAMTISRQDAERDSGKQAEEMVAPGSSASPSGAVSADGSTIIRPMGESRQDVPAAPAEPEMVRIMQSDGTMKLEARYGNKKTI